MKKTLNLFLALAFIFFNAFFFIYLSIKINYPVLYKNEFKSASESTNVEISLLLSIAKTESSFSPQRTSSAGAVGIMQIMPQTAKYVCEINGFQFDENRLFDADYNILLGANYYRYLLDKFGDESSALAAYNAGEGNVKVWLQNPEYSDDGKTLKDIPFGETKNYVQKVVQAKKVYQKIKL